MGLFPYLVHPEVRVLFLPSPVITFSKHVYPMFILLFSTDKEKWQPLPLVTITEENEEALGNKLFRQALKKVGLKPPANEQVSLMCSMIVFKASGLAHDITGN